MVKVIDIFAGPGGLSEGFSSVSIRGRGVFDVVLSIEKDEHAHQTLKLRTFYRQFHRKVPGDYYEFLKGEITLEDLYNNHQRQEKIAEEKCWLHELGEGESESEETYQRIKKAVGDDNNVLLIGGPPCQAYSLAGRSRNAKNSNYDETKDKRQTLYVEYLQILADHGPAVFVMENVKGLLSAKYKKVKIFEKILSDLREPAEALKREGRKIHQNQAAEYNIYSLTTGELLDDDPAKAVIKSEIYGIPQKRHRVILLGIRKDLGDIKPIPLEPLGGPVTVSEVISGLPPLRSGISKTADSADIWTDKLKSQISSDWIEGIKTRIDNEEFCNFMKSQITRITPSEFDLGGEYVKYSVSAEYRQDWYCETELEGACNHKSRKHIEKDLYRYFYASSYGKFFDSSPKLGDFPRTLLPDHANVKKAIKSKGIFSDRFRVQLGNRPGTTVVSHISKDGHYYIHPDPLQCRSFTVREAARIQTFKDNYFFCGNRTSQYQQVGNAVPPLLARQIAIRVYEVFKQLHDQQGND